MKGELSAIGGQAAAFLQWWRDELAALVPQAVRRVLSGRPRLTAVDIDVEGNFTAGAGPGFSRRGSSERIPAPGTACRLRLPPAAVLGKIMTLPEGAGASLSDVLRLQVEQETPFRAGEVYAGHVVVERDRRTRKIVVDWRLVPRSAADPALQRATALALRVQELGITSDDPALADFIFDLGQPRTRSRRTGRLRAVLAATLVGLLLAAGAIPLLRKYEAASALDARLTHAQQLATKVSQLRDSVEEEHAVAGFVVEQRLVRPTVSELLRELTDALPDDTWLQRLAVKGDEVSIAGLSASTSALVAGLDAHPWFREVAYRAPTLRQRNGSHETFDLKFRLASGERDP